MKNSFVYLYDERTTRGMPNTYPLRVISIGVPKVQVLGVKPRAAPAARARPAPAAPALVIMAKDLETFPEFL